MVVFVCLQSRPNVFISAFAARGQANPEGLAGFATASDNTRRVKSIRKDNNSAHTWFAVACPTLQRIRPRCQNSAGRPSLVALGFSSLQREINNFEVHGDMSVGLRGEGSF